MSKLYYHGVNGGDNDDDGNKGTLHVLILFECVFESHIRIQIQINQLIIFMEKFSPLPGFEPRTSRVPSRCATN